MSEHAPERNIDLHPYSQEEQKVASFFFECGIGGGNDPIGSIIASHQYLAADRARLMRENEAMRNLLLSVVREYPVASGLHVDMDGQDGYGPLKSARKYLGLAPVSGDIASLKEPSQCWQMGEKLEQVARAIGSRMGDYSAAGWLGDETHAMGLDCARAAVEALRKPPDLRDAPHIDCAEQTYVHEGQMETIWRSMIDELLK